MKTKRLFFALWPTSEITQSIKQNTDIIKKSIDGNFSLQSNWHITLAFIGNTDTNTLACLIEQASKIQCPSFFLEFNKVLYLKKPKILSYTVSNNSDNSKLNFLVHECKQIQDECGLKSESRQYLPHMSVARKVKQPDQELIISAIPWQATEFVLVSSKLTERGSEYTVLKRWLLNN